MRRTQIMLDEWQYELLKALSQRHRQSMSSIIREAVAAYLATDNTKAAKRLPQIEGIGDDPEATGRNHDRFLYGKSSRH